MCLIINSSPYREINPSHWSQPHVALPLCSQMSNTIKTEKSESVVRSWWTVCLSPAVLKQADGEGQRFIVSVAGWRLSGSFPACWIENREMWSFTIYVVCRNVNMCCSCWIVAAISIVELLCSNRENPFKALLQIDKVNTATAAVVF